MLLTCSSISVISFFNSKMSFLKRDFVGTEFDAEEILVKCSELANAVMIEMISHPGLQRAANNPKFLLYILAFSSLTIWLLVRGFKTLRVNRGNILSTPILEKSPNSILRTLPRTPGGRLPCYLLLLQK